jgi:hypothetical protein
MPEIRFNITENLDKLVLNVSKKLGVDKSDYVKGLILQDLRKYLSDKNSSESK